MTATHGESQDYLLFAGVHIHHLVIGVVAILIAGVFALVVGLLALAVNAWRGRPFIQDVMGTLRRRP